MWFWCFHKKRWAHNLLLCHLVLALQQSAFLSIAFLNSFSIFIISFLNSVSIRLKRSLSLFVLLGDFSWSFNWKSFFCSFILLIFPWLYEFRRNNYLLWLWMAIFMWEHFFVACMGLIFLVQGLFLVWMPASCFLSVCWMLSSWWGVLLVLWWPQPALDVEQGLFFAIWLSQPFQGQGLLPSCWIGSPQIHFWAVVLGRRNWSSPTGRGTTVYSSTGAVLWGLRSVVWPVTCSVGSQTTLLLALPSALPQPWQFQKLALVSLRCCFHEDTSADP